jgi:hypothetical protein
MLSTSSIGGMVGVERLVHVLHARQLLDVRMLLEHQLGLDACRRAHQRDRAALQVLHHQLAHQRVVAHHVHLGGAALSSTTRSPFVIFSVAGSFPSGDAASFEAAFFETGSASSLHFDFLHRCREFARDAFGRLVGAQALEHRVAHRAGIRPFGKADLGDQLGLDPMVLAPRDRARREGADVGVEGFQFRRDVAQALRIEAAADVARVAQHAFLVVGAQQQRADAGARTLGVGVAGDHEFLALAAFQLDPFGRAARDIARVAALADHAFQADLAGGGHQPFRDRCRTRRKNAPVSEARACFSAPSSSARRSTSATLRRS